MNIKQFLLKPIYKIAAPFYMSKIKKGVTKKDFTIISNDCCGGVVYHRIGKRFSSPFINLYLEHSDFFLLLSDLNYYLSEELKEYISDEKYPIGILGNNKPIKIHFLHYKSFEEAKDSWSRRKERIIKNKLLIMLNLTNSLDKKYVDDCIKKLELLNFENYVIFSRFASQNPNVVKIDFSDLKSFHNAQILAPQKYPFKLHIDQIEYAKLFKRFN